MSVTKDLKTFKIIKRKENNDKGPKSNRNRRCFELFRLHQSVWLEKDLKPTNNENNVSQPVYESVIPRSF